MQSTPSGRRPPCLGRHTHALLEALRARGLRLGLVSNAFDPRRILDRDLERMGLAGRLDVCVFSSEVGVRKPHPEIFRRALDQLVWRGGRALFVGDRLYEDVRGAGEAGMTTVQAVWFRADEHPRGADRTSRPSRRSTSSTSSVA